MDGNPCLVGMRRAADVCRRGHKFEGTNLRIVMQAGRPHRVCRACAKYRHGRNYHENEKYRASVIAGVARRYQQRKAADPGFLLSLNERNRRNHRQLRERLMAKLGGAVCRCCGESEYAFLTFDHIHGNGAQDRKRFNGRVPYVWVTEQIKSSDAAKRLQVLCFNCNIAKGKSGACPHQSGLLALVSNGKDAG